LPSQFVILAPGESSRAAHHRIAWHAAAILRVLDERFRLLIWGRGPEARSVQEFSAKVKQPELVIDAEKRLGRDVSFEEVAGAADVALSTGSSDASLLPLAACAAAGLPIVATESAAMGETFGAKGIVTVPRKDVRTLSQTLLELQENPARGGELGAEVRARAAAVFDAARFVRQYAELYERVARRHGRHAGMEGMMRKLTAETAMVSDGPV
jgi:glycosyltransferase involved in cell wall biosynthesis